VWGQTCGVGLHVISPNLTSPKLKFFPECRRRADDEGQYFGQYMKLMFKKVQLRWRLIFGGEVMIDCWVLGWKACQSYAAKPSHGQKFRDSGSNGGLGRSLCTGHLRYLAFLAATWSSCTLVSDYVFVAHRNILHGKHFIVKLT
jgi:hypothetical protein